MKGNNSSMGKSPIMESNGEIVTLNVPETSYNPIIKTDENESVLFTTDPET